MSETSVQMRVCKKSTPKIRDWSSVFEYFVNASTCAVYIACVKIMIWKLLALSTLRCVCLYWNQSSLYPYLP